MPDKAAIPSAASRVVEGQGSQPFRARQALSRAAVDGPEMFRRHYIPYGKGG
ncbi:MAG TPA: hypothetical protein VKL61_05330 [Candidatus Polarisedimenticolia bacterium]|nr:hypothetical protein [Candidatus Polarisedimenticolia bacterium]